MIENIKPMDIEKRSFEIISELLGDKVLDPQNELVIKRAIHTTADFDYADNLVFSENAVAKGIDLSKVDASSRHGSLVPPATRYSTLQDLDAGRHTEIDMFSGALMRMGQELGIPTPYNEYTYHMIKALEEKNDGLFDYAAKASDLTCAK